MKKLNHVSVSFALSFWVFYFIFEKNIIITFFFALFVSTIAWFPDVDITIIKKTNSLNKKTFYLLCPITIFFKLFFKHRTITHSIWLPLSLLIYSEFFSTSIYLIDLFRIIYIAIFLHILEDSFTRAGVRLFYPIPLKIKFANFSTDSQYHCLFFEICSYIILFMFFGMFFYVNFAF